MSAGLKAMNDHVKAVKNIKKITHSMKVVAAAKFSKSEKDLRTATPLGQGALFFYTLSKFHKQVAVPHVRFFAITSDRGLSGSMNSRICKFLKQRAEKLNQPYDIVCVGEKAKSILQFDVGRKIAFVVNGVGHKAPIFLDAARIIMRTFKKDDFMEGNLVFTKFKNMVSFNIESVSLYTMPLLLNTHSMNNFEFDDKEDLLSFLEFSQTAILYYAMCQTYLVELSSRIMAMTNASKNAEKMVAQLQLERNRKRQALITTELTDIVSGAQVVTTK